MFQTVSKNLGLSFYFILNFSLLKFFLKIISNHIIQIYAILAYYFKSKSLMANSTSVPLYLLFGLYGCSEVCYVTTFWTVACGLSMFLWCKNTYDFICYVWSKLGTCVFHWSFKFYSCDWVGSSRKRKDSKRNHLWDLNF